MRCCTVACSLCAASNCSPLPLSGSGCSAQHRPQAVTRYRSAPASALPRTHAKRSRSSTQRRRLLCPAPTPSRPASPPACRMADAEDVPAQKRELVVPCECCCCQLARVEQAHWLRPPPAHSSCTPMLVGLCGAACATCRPTLKKVRHEAHSIAQCALHCTHPSASRKFGCILAKLCQQRHTAWLLLSCSVGRAPRRGPSQQPRGYHGRQHRTIQRARWAGSRAHR